MTPAQSLDARAAAPTPSGGVQIAPRPRRADYLLTAAVGLVLPPLIMAPLGIASYFAAHHRLPWALLLIALALAVCSMAQGFFAVRSSLGGLVAGLVALAVHAVVLCAPQGAQSAPMPWARAFLPTGALLIAAGVLLGGSWGMRRARRAGRADARLAMRLAAADRAMGVTPQAPPSRRRDHVMSFVVTATRRSRPARPGDLLRRPLNPRSPGNRAAAHTRRPARAASRCVADDVRSRAAHAVAAQRSHRHGAHHDRPAAHHNRMGSPLGETSGPGRRAGRSQERGVGDAGQWNRPRMTGARRAAPHSGRLGTPLPDRPGSRLR